MLIMLEYCSDIDLFPKNYQTLKLIKKESGE